MKPNLAYAYQKNAPGVQAHWLLYDGEKKESRQFVLTPGQKGAKKVALKEMLAFIEASYGPAEFERKEDGCYVQTEPTPKQASFVQKLESLVVEHQPTA